MSRYVFKMPDLGEGTVSAEILDWRVKPGDVVTEDTVIAEVMTDKAAIEIPAPVAGRVVSCVGEPGDKVAVGSELIVFETDTAAVSPASEPQPAQQTTTPKESNTQPAAAAEMTGRVMTSPAIRRRAKEAGVDLRTVSGSGPNGRITPNDFTEHLAKRTPSSRPTIAPAAGDLQSIARTGTEEIKVIGVRRLIAERMTQAKRNIPHFGYVEEIDVTELESLRAHLNQKHTGESALTYLPFIVLALARVLKDFPQCNATYDAERNVIVRHRAVNVGVATQTPEGLKVPVVQHAEARTLWDTAAEIRRVSTAARNNTARREELTGSTITITSLGKLGGVVTAPVINAPEVAIVGINKVIERPVVVAGTIAVRRMMNISSAFDHRFVDGYDAATMIQALKELLEHPATIFIGEQ